MKFLLLLIPSVLFAQAQSTSDSSAERLRFNWPVGTAAVVETDYVNQTTARNAVHQDALVRMTHEMRVGEASDGRVLENTRQQRVQSSGDPSSALRSLLPLWIPRIVLNKNGEFVRIEEAGRVQQLVTKAYEPQFNSAPAQAFPAFKRFLAMMTSTDALKTAAAAEWIATTGRWVGATLDPKPIEGRSAVRVAPDVSIPAVAWQGVTGRLPCTRGDAMRDCVTLEIRQTLPPEGLEALMNYATRGVNATSPGRLTFYETVHRATLETDTMLPHEVSITQTMRRVVNVDGRGVTVEVLERRTMRYMYKDGPSGR